MNALKEYSEHLTIVRAHEAICKDLERAAIRELMKFGFSITVRGVDLEVVRQIERTYPRADQKRINKLLRTVKLIRHNAELNRKVKSRVVGTSIRGKIRKTMRCQVLSRIPAYRSHFGRRP